MSGRGFVAEGLWAGVGAAIITRVVSLVAGTLIQDDPPKR